MSFFSGNRQGNLPGPIRGNVTSGLCEKAVIQVRKVFDACMKQIQESNVSVTLTNLDPATPTYPLTFVSCNSNGDVVVNNLVVTRFDDKPCFARVSLDAEIPVTVNYTDANGIAGTGTTMVTVSNDVVLYIPQPSIVPYQIEAFGSAICSDGESTSTTTPIFNLDLCITLVIKVVVIADILVPTYGYATIPPCQEYSQDVCTGFFDLPLFPSQQPVEPNQN